MALAAVLWLLLVDNERHELRWNFRAGEVLRYRTVQVMGSPGKEACHVTISSFTVGQVSADGSAEITSLVERTTVHEGGPEGPVTWDSAAGQAVPRDLPIASAAAMTGVPVKLRVDRQGRVVTSEGKEAIQERIRENLGGDLFGLFSELPFSNVGERLIGPPLPSAAVRRHDRWSAASGVGTAMWGSTTFLEEYALDGVSGDLAILTLIRTEMKQTPGDAAKAPGTENAPPDPHMDRGWQDTATFSLSRGRLFTQRGRTWTQGALPNGKIFRFESRTETTLLAP